MTILLAIVLALVFFYALSSVFEIIVSLIELALSVLFKLALIGCIAAVFYFAITLFVH